jgi:hypothetical protein
MADNLRLTFIRIPRSIKHRSPRNQRSFLSKFRLPIRKTVSHMGWQVFSISHHDHVRMPISANHRLHKRFMGKHSIDGAANPQL